LHGKFAKPYQLFRADAQRSLVAAYAASTDTKPLPFRMSYQRTEGANLQVAWRPGLQTIEARVRAARMPQAQMLEARIAEQLASYTQRRRKLFLTRSVSDTRHASYVDTIRSYVSSLLGARARSSNGAALISLSLAPDGTLQVVQVERNSGSTTFDRHVKTVLQGSRRFPAWPESMRKDGDLAVVMLHVPEL
jgi:TonB family protein